MKIKLFFLFFFAKFIYSVDFNIRVYLCMYVYSKEKSFADTQFKKLEERFSFSDNNNERKEKTRTNYNLLLFGKCKNILEKMTDREIYLRLNDLMTNSDKFVYKYYFELNDDEMKSAIFPLGNSSDKLIKELQYINSINEEELRNVVSNFYSANMENPTFKSGINLIFRGEEGFRFFCWILAILFVFAVFITFCFCYCHGRNDRAFENKISQTINSIKNAEERSKKNN
jgi:hypothetical protein